MKLKLKQLAFAAAISGLTLQAIAQSAPPAIPAPPALPSPAAEETEKKPEEPEATEKAAPGPYDVILDRNPFGLNPPPPPPPPPPPEAPPPEVNIMLTGITTLFGKAAFLKTVDPTTQEIKKFKLKEGESENQIEILEIIPDAGVVRIKRGDREMELNFEDNGNTATPSAPTARPVGVQPRATYNTTGRGGGGGGGNRTPPGMGRTTQTRTPPRTQNSNRVAPLNIPSPSQSGFNVRGYSRPANGKTPVISSPAGGARSIPSRNLRVQPPSANVTTQPAPNIDPNAQAVQMEVNRVIQPASDGFPPFPQIN